MSPWIKFTCPQCERTFELPCRPEGDTCDSCRFANDCITRSRARCGSIIIPKYKLCDLPEALPTFGSLGWQVELAARPLWLRTLGKVFNGEGTRLTLHATSEQTCSGRPSACRFKQLPTAAKVMQSKHEFCNRCPLKQFKPRDRGHLRILKRCTNKLSCYDASPVQVNMRMSEVGYLPAVLDELTANGWSVDVSAWNRFPGIRLRISPANGS